MNSTPMIVNRLLDQYTSLLEEKLPNLLEGLYLQGSIALGAFDQSLSDVDFIAVTKNRLTNEEINILSQVHQMISDRYTLPAMDGIYIVWEDIGNAKSFDNARYPFYNEGNIGYGTHFNPITWWLLKTRGINIKGPERNKLDINVTQKELMAYVYENMNSYWLNRVQRLEKLKTITMKEINIEVEWTVLGLLRQYYTLMEKDIISKLEAGYYGLEILPTKWHPIIQEAINIRKNVKEDVLNTSEEKLKQTLDFSYFIICHCNELLNEY